MPGCQLRAGFPRRGSRLILFVVAAFGLLILAPASSAAPAPQAAPEIRGGEVSLAPNRFRPVSGAASTRDGSLSISSAGVQSTYESEVTEAPLPFTDVAASWRGDDPAGSDVVIELRTSADGQAWSDWHLSDREDIVDPRDPADTVYTSLVPVPQSAGPHRFVQARITLTSAVGATPPTVRDLTLSFIDAGITTGSLQSQISAVVVPPAKPALILRQTWGAPSGSKSPDWPVQYRRATHIIVHHTATLNDDSDPAARIRAVWYYHAKTRGWGDIGYNYLIDARGNVYEGRAGGDDAVAGHAYPFNYGSVGVALLGDFDEAEMPNPMHNALIRLLAWKSAQRGINPLGSSTFTGSLDCGGNFSLARPNIAGHRDFRGTGCGAAFNTSTCPGDRVWVLLPDIRKEVAAAMPPYRALFQSNTTPQTMLPGSVVNATVTVRNGGSLVWPRGGANPVHLAFRWYTLDGALVTGGYRDARVELPRDMPYGDTVTLTARVGAPATPGVYNLSWDMVHEQVAWFGDRASAPLTVRVSVAQSDNTAPTSRVLPLNPYQQLNMFTVSWSGSDEVGGSGLAAFDVQYKAGAGGAWTDWQRGARATSVPFSGQEGVTYQFRSRASDAAGNIEAYADVSDAVTTVDSTAPSLVISSPRAGEQVRAGALVVSGRTDPDALISVNSVAAAQAGGVYTVTIQAKGENVAISVVASDPAGNETSRTITVRAVGRLSDVPPGDPAYEAVEYLSALGIISGYDDGTFRPTGNATRAQYTKLLATALDWPLPKPQVARFRDVPVDNWATLYVESAAAQGLVSGYADGSFRPNEPVTRAQAVKVLVLAVQKRAPHDWRLLQGPQSPFVDVPLGHWAYPYLETAYRHGAVQLSADTRFQPDRPATRAEISMMIYYSLGDLAALGKGP